MDLNELKEIIENEGGKIVIVEDGTPRMVIMAFEEWQKKRGGAWRSGQSAPRIRAEQPRASESEPQPMVGEDRAAGGELTIDDLPL